MFLTIYESPWHHPGVCWAAGLVLLGLAALFQYGRRGRELRERLGLGSRLGLYVFLELLILCDATLTGALSPLDPKGAAASRVAVLFVLLGDARYYYLLFADENARHGARLGSGLRAAALALVASAILPLLAMLLQRRWPVLLPTPRHLFLMDEVLLLTAVSAIATALSRREKSPAQRFRLRLSLFVAGQYGLWALADLLILGGWFAEPGYALRLVPNALYYAAFVPFAAWADGQSARAELALPLAEAA